MSTRTFWILVVVLSVIAVGLFYLFYRSSLANSSVMGPSPSGYGDLSSSDQFSQGMPIYSSVPRNVYRGTSSGWILYDDHPANELLGFFMGFKDVRINTDSFTGSTYPIPGALQNTGITYDNLKKEPHILIVMNTRSGGGGDEISTFYTPDLYTK